jgi:hypothetical protein
MSILAPDRTVRFTIILFLHGERTKRLNTRKIRRVTWLLANREWDKVYLKIVYGRSGMINEGEYTDPDFVRAALSAFTEPELIADVFGLSVPTEEIEE